MLINVAFYAALLGLIITFLITYRKEHSFKKLIFLPISLSICALLFNRWGNGLLSETNRLTVDSLKNVTKVSINRADSLQNKVDSLTVTLDTANAKIDRLEKRTTPIPFHIRLKKMLNEINPGILDALKKGQMVFESVLSGEQYKRLEELSKESANEFFTIEKLKSITSSMGVDITLEAKIILNRQLLAK